MHNILKIVELYTLSGQIVWYMKYVSIKLLKKREDSEQTSGCEPNLTNVSTWLSAKGIRKRCRNSIFQTFWVGSAEAHTYFNCMKPKSGLPSYRQFPPHGHCTLGKLACVGSSVPTACRVTPTFSQHLIFPNKRRNEAHKTQQWIDEQLCIYIEFPGNKACSPTSWSLFGRKLCFAFSQCPLPSPVCPPNLN